MKKLNNYGYLFVLPFFLVFLVISLSSMLTGDTIETQTGVSFFAFFYSLFLFGRKENDAIIQHEIKR